LTVMTYTKCILKMSSLVLWWSEYMCIFCPMYPELWKK
jgi:hypothetical protein